MSMSSKIRSKLVSFTVSSPSHPDLFKMTNVWIVDNLTLPKQKIDIEDLKGSYQHLHDLDFTLIGDSDAAILIGTDFPQWHWYRDIKTGKEHELIAIQSSLGWVLLGGKDNNKNTTSSNSFQSFTSPPLDQIVENVWEIESYGMKHKETSSVFSKEEQRAIQTLERTVSFENNHNSAGLLWKNDQPSRINNQNLVSTRL